MKLGEMLLAPARVWPARMEQRHLLVAPLTYIKKPEVCVAKATYSEMGQVTRAQQVWVRGREEREGRSWGTGKEWGKWSQCEAVEPLL